MFAHYFNNKLFYNAVAHFIYAFGFDYNNPFKIRLYYAGYFTAGNIFPEHHGKKRRRHGVFLLGGCDLKPWVARICGNEKFKVISYAPYRNYKLVFLRLVNFVYSASEQFFFKFVYYISYSYSV